MVPPEDPDNRLLRTGDLGVALVVLAYAVSAGVGLPLYGDGAFYLFNLVLDRVPEIPNLRLAALLPQVPAWTAAAQGADVSTLRLVFSLGYVCLPALSLLACWVAVRRQAPALILFPALFTAANQVNLSGVSELIAALHWIWPFCLLSALRPASWSVWVYGVLLGPLLILLHPLAFAPLLLVATLVALNATRSQPVGHRWSILALWLALAALSRLIWTLLGVNDYEREQLSSTTGIANYLLPATGAQASLLALTLTLGSLLAVSMAGRSDRLAPWPDWLTSIGLSMMPIVGLWIGSDYVSGEGIKLKAGLILPLGLLFMGLAAVSAMARMRSRTVRHGAAVLLACVLTTTLLVSAKSLAWWNATQGLMETMASTDGDCEVFGPQVPPGLQGPRMAMVDNWTAPLSALIFRVPDPIALLLPRDGCRLLQETGWAELDSWIRRRADVLEAGFGPLRHP